MFDNQMLRADRGRELPVLAAENRWKTQVVYVHRPFELVVRGVIARSVRTGRWNRLADLPTIHTQAQDTFWSLATDPTLAADFVVLENLATTENPVAVRLFGSAVLGPRELRRYTHVESLKRVLHAEIEAAIRGERLPEPVRSLCTGAGGA